MVGYHLHCHCPQKLNISYRYVHSLLTGWMSARLLIIGLDGADGRMLDRASRDGTLPNLAALRTRGRAWALSSAHGATDDALWASFQYGADVGEHGRYSFHLQTGSEQPAYAPNQELDRETFWDRLSQQNLRVAILDVPKCRPPRPLNGIHLVDWLVHGRYFHSPLSYPEELAADILARFGAPPPSRCEFYPPMLSDDEVRAVRDNLHRAVSQKRAAGLHYLSAAGVGPVHHLLQGSALRLPHVLGICRSRACQT